jgi:putative PIN family toxin of toxin-antitoxin system
VSRFQRVVFDTSTVVGAALRVGSTPHEALSFAFDHFDLCASAETLAELEEVLDRAKFDRYVNREKRQIFVANLKRRVHLFVVPNATVIETDPPCRDPKDNPFLALALIAEADVLVSSDQDLLILNPWHGIPILSPAQFLAAYSETATR